MSQIYKNTIQSPFTPASPQKVTEGGTSFPFGSFNEQPTPTGLENSVAAYEAQRDRLSTAIDSTNDLLKDFMTFNSSNWQIRYPDIQPLATRPPVSSASSTPHINRSLRRSLSFADEPSQIRNVVFNKTHTSSVQRMAAPRRSLSLLPASEDSKEETHTDDVDIADSTHATGFKVLNLDLKLGPNRSSKSLVMSLERSSISKLLDGRISTQTKHLESLKDRILDTSSKVLITGDLNSGKSTFVNALLRRDVMPVDQQPCTTIFCTVHDARDNGDREEAHVQLPGKTYNLSDKATYSVHSLAELEEMVVDVEDDTRPPIRVYVSDTRTSSESLIHNGVVDISLIDAPGLNRDSLKTTAVFARQDEIDVVVFCVSAANHFTLSAKEFIWTASNEKAYLFIVVNKFDQIRDKERCKRVILEQIRQLSPRTWEDAEELVHFVDSSRIMELAQMEGPPPAETNSEAFEHLESALRSFVLDKRAKSKLLPVQTFVSHLLSDLDILASANILAANDEIVQAQAELERTKPILDEMKRGQDGFERKLESIEDETVALSGERAKARLTKALDSVVRGEIAPEAVGIELPTYPGLLDLWDYAHDVKLALLASLDAAVVLAEHDARQITSIGVNQVSTLGEKHLPQGVDRPKKVFRPEAMFAPKGGRLNRRMSGSIGNVGLGLAARRDLSNITLGDVFDVHQQLARIYRPFFADADSSFTSEDSAKESQALVPYGLTAVGVVSLIGGKTLATRSLVECFFRLADILRSPVARQWAGPIVAAATVGLGYYILSELPRTIPRRIGSNIRQALLAQNEENERWDDQTAGRVSLETKRVLRAAAWNLRSTFAGAMEERAEEVRRAEAGKKKAEQAIGWFENVERRAEDIRLNAGFRVQQNHKQILA
ncbi:transmembrane gtpase fzo1 [Phaffia rhodozyma]|uniref:Transmembrane gtpase fzo1 n=1 Tax=Phaffia rhodozyma TaxID=264483 RepID=A0A0F7SJY6_PHARH|nr:transmembrane gtpase fzo1 [Phaffia rhodozyma]